MQSLKRTLTLATFSFFIMFGWWKGKSEKLALTNGLRGWITMAKVTRVDGPCVVVWR
jgi:hypothetical protein